MSSPFKLFPDRLGRFMVGATLARGGMARIHVGRSDDGEIVALKVIDPSLQHNPEFVSLFLDEGRVLSMIDHPNVVKTVEVGFDEAHYIAMELLRGRTLLEVWEAVSAGGKKMPWKLAAWVCAELAKGVQAAHDLQDPNGGGLRVIHRDVNPANVFLTFNGSVKLIDFGLAKSHGQRSKSAPGIVKGKLPYLAPEQAHNEYFDQRVDVFSIGVTLWECFTMKRLFRRETDILTLQAVQLGEVPDPRIDAPELPDEMLEVLKKALASYPKDRYGSARALAQDLEAVLAKEGFNEGMALQQTYLAELFPGDARAQEFRAGRARSLLDPDEVEFIQPTPAAPMVMPQSVKMKKAVQGKKEDEPAPAPKPAPAPPESRSSRPVVTALVGAVALALTVWALSKLFSP